MKKKIIYIASLIFVLTSCGAKTPADYANEYNDLVSSLATASDSAQRNEIFKKMSEVQIDARAKLKKDELKEFLRLTDDLSDGQTDAKTESETEK